MRVRPIVLLPFPALLAGCLAALIPARMQSWDGRQSSELIARWGEPEAILKDANGRTTLVWVRTEQRPVPGEFQTKTVSNFVMTDSGTVVDQPITYLEFTPGAMVLVTEVVTVRVDARGRIIGVSSQEHAP
jgi:hypothetical protein